MYRRAAGARSALAVAWREAGAAACTAVRRAQVTPPPPPPPPLPELGATVSEERVARWCRRLWELTHKSSGSVARIAADPQRDSATVSFPSAHQPLSSSLPPPSPPPPPASRAGCDTEVTGEEVLSRLRRAIRGDQGRIPGAVVESVWAAFDVLVPPAVQDSVTHDSVTAAAEENFFLFVSTLGELNFDLQAVTTASAQLSAKVGAYTELLRQAETSTATAAELAQRLTTAQGEVMQVCFEARNAGSPLYYTWLRHTATMSDGLRRLMQFRKLVHFFESLCKRRVRRLTSAPAAGAERREDALALWRRRLVEVGLIDSALSLLFHDFFAKEYLVMEELTWLSTPPAMLDKIMRAESVHPFTRGLDDMRYRLQPAHHRHLFAFLHPSVVEEPLVAVQVALMRGIARSVDEILHRPTPLSHPENTSAAARAFRDCAAAAASASGDGDVDTAIFYSINSAQSALRGMDMGNRLIKRVVQEVEGDINASRQARRLTPIHTFSTLSPIPLYVKWLEGEAATLTAAAAAAAAAATPVVDIFGVRPCASGEAEEVEETRYWAPLRKAVTEYARRHPDVLPPATRAAVLAAAAGADSRVAANAAVLQYVVKIFRMSPASSSSPPLPPVPGQPQPWWMDHEFTVALEAPLLRSVATYLCRVKRARGGRIRDPVANFHVSNGATVYRLNFLGNATAQGSRESACVMVNYWYDLSAVSMNAAQYEANQTVSLGDPVAALLASVAETASAPRSS
ncbi:malonyl-coa decarboxylase-like protein [Novymonas esmeraldas]|uniref:Malonyl-coa decarboxylase-like protein n=1 Tax=Novymonas esmeraldas TaxID=1808958 RepID=A0AAW0F6T3_9TRYP